MRSLAILPVALTLLLLSPLTAAEQRHALVMGVWDYEDAKFPALPGIQADVTRMSTRLSELGFKVTEVTNPTLREAKKAVDDFGATLKAAGKEGVGLFYFSGHGCENEGTNCLVPKGTVITSRKDLDDEALSAQRVLIRMEESGARVNLVFLDCCRNTFTKGAGGLAPMEPAGVFVGYATASAKEANAADGGSPYTEALIREMAKPGLSISDMHTRVTDAVKRVTEGSQNPFQYSGLDRVFYMVPGTPMASTVDPSSLAPNVTAGSRWIGSLTQEGGRDDSVEFYIDVTSRSGADITGIVGFEFTNNSCAIRFKGNVDNGRIVFSTYEPIKGSVSYPAYYSGTLTGNTITGTWRVPTYKQKGDFQANKQGGSR